MLCVSVSLPVFQLNFHESISYCVCLSVSHKKDRILDEVVEITVFPLTDRLVSVACFRLLGGRALIQPEELAALPEGSAARAGLPRWRWGCWWWRQMWFWLICSNPQLSVDLPDALFRNNPIVYISLCRWEWRNVTAQVAQNRNKPEKYHSHKSKCSSLCVALLSWQKHHVVGTGNNPLVFQSSVLCIGVWEMLTVTKFVYHEWFRKLSFSGGTHPSLLHR